MMKRTLCSALLLALLGASEYLAADGAHATATLRVLTYNIHHGQGTDGEFDLPRLASVIASASPDIVALQELDQGTARSSGVYQLAELARLTNMAGTFGKAMDFQGGSYGVGVLSRLPVINAATRAMPGTPDREPRTELTVEVAMGSGRPPLTFTSTHFDQGRDPADRIAQAGFLNQVLGGEEDGAPSILAGDFNSRSETEVMQILGQRWADVFTAPMPFGPSGRPEIRVDYILARPLSLWRTVDSQVIDNRLASDHRPVLAILEWSGH